MSDHTSLFPVAKFGPDARLGMVDRWLLNVGAVMGALCLALAGASLLLGMKPLIFASGSMAPAMPTGYLALTVPVSSLDVVAGDVVSVVSAGGTRVTHRVLSADPVVGLVLKGDANSIADLQPFAGKTVDRVFASFPYLGYFASWLGSPWLLLLGCGLCAYLIYIAFVKGVLGRSRGCETSPSGEGTRPRKWNWFGAGAAAVVIAVAVPLGVVVKFEPTQAAMVAAAEAKSSVSLGILKPPTQLKCAASGTGNQNIDVSWTAPSGNQPMPLSYRVTVGVNGKYTTSVVTETQLTMGLSKESGGLLGGVVKLLDSLVGGLLQLLLGGPQDVSVSVATVYGRGWESPVLANGKIAAISKPLLQPMVVKCN